jgi:Carboxypeptidase regulatory-like domain
MPIAGAQVRIRPDPETPYNRGLSKSASSDQNGHFRINDLVPGKYRVTAKLQIAAEDAPVVASEPKFVVLGGA